MSNDKAAATFHPFTSRPTMRFIGIAVPWNEVLSMNSRAHWANTHRQVHALRNRGHIMARAMRDMPRFNQASCTVFMRFPDKRRRDVENYHATLKPIIDGFVDAGILPDDDSRHLVHLAAQFYVAGVFEDVDLFMPVQEAARPTLSLVFAFEGVK